MLGGKRWHLVGAMVMGVVAVATVVVWVVADTDSPDFTAESKLGELSTIDPCSLIDLGVVSSFGKAELDDKPVSFDECIVDIETPAGAHGFLWVGELDRTESHSNIDDKQARDLPGGLEVVDYQEGSNYCTRLLVFPDAVTLSVRYHVYYGDDPKVKACDVVAAAMDKVVEVVRGGGVKHRTFPPRSLGTVDPCAITPADAPARLPQLRAVKPKSRPGKHVCTWSTGDDAKTEVRVDFSMLVADTPDSRQGIEETIAGRASRVNRRPSSRIMMCTVETVHIPFAAEGQRGLVEIANVVVQIPEGQIPEVMCETAVDVATAVWPKLPTP